MYIEVVGLVRSIITDISEAETTAKALLKLLI